MSFVLGVQVSNARFEDDTSKKIKNLFANIEANRKKFKVEEEMIRAKKREVEKRAKEADRIERLKTRWRFANVPESFKKSSLKPFVSKPLDTQEKINFLNQTKVINLLRTYNPLHANAVFYGLYGLGKSYFASYFVRKVVVEGKSAGFVSASDYIRFCKQDLVRAERMEKMDFLVLDEVGNSDIPAWDLVHLKDLLIRRENAGVKTLITTNLPINDLRQYLKGTAQDRMLNNSTFYVDFNQIDGACSLRGRV